MQYLAIIGDIVDSKQLRDRAKFQTSLATTLKGISMRNAALVSPYTITLGDEFQAVYKSADRLFLDLFTILRDLHPVQARFAIGLGELSTGINRKQALGMDGPAFHRAREGITRLKATSSLITLQGPSPAPTPGFDVWRLFNHLLNFVSHKVVAWEENRLRIFCGLLAGRSVAELETELGISKVAVYKNLNAAALDELQGLCHEITAFLNQALQTS